MEMAMQFRRFGRTELQVSEISLGGAYISGTLSNQLDPDARCENAIALVERALELGVNYIDTAPLYGDSESLVGSALSAVGKKMHIATKVGFDPEGFDYRADSVLRSVERSLQRLDVNRLTTVQIHEVNLAGWERITENGGTLDGLRAAQKEGLCTFVGITGRAIPLLMQLTDTGEFDTVLVYHDYHPMSNLAAEKLIPAAKRSNMGIIIATILAGGLFGHAERSENALAELSADKSAMAKRVLGMLHEQSGTLPQHAFRWVLGDERVSTACSGACSIGELEEVVQAISMGPLPENLVRKMSNDG